MDIPTLLYACMLIMVPVAVIAALLVAIKDLVYARGSQPPSYYDDKMRRALGLFVGVCLSGYTAYGILTAAGLDIIAALLGTLGIALVLYGLGFDGMLNAIRGYFNSWKKGR